MTDESRRMAQMQRWLEAVCTELGIDPEVLDDTTVDLLALIRDVAHGPSRPGAPLSAFLIGLSAGSTRPDLSPAQTAQIVTERVAAVERLVAAWPTR